ncbi:hypothetical protein QWY77_12665 [Thalassotalea ponticola]|uniref:hypothetical protein n=1 Tax=Thalassotalea ponticola TaxID=1523392 RepID=UPI0025B51FFC|nr:hypothetical protein [Thalassotalea ponticola]MDN3653597.1 hypothetical protein [Thalassotalea ponticola]
MKRLVCSRFDSNIPNAAKIKKHKVNFTNPRVIKESNYYCLATDGNEVFNGKRMSLDSFFQWFSDKNETLLVLTDKEASLLVRWANIFEVKLVSFESSFPIFTDIRFNPNLEKSFVLLEKHLSYIKRIGLNSNRINSELIMKSGKTIKRKFGNKTNYDVMFAHAYLPPYQEVFRFCEFRKDRMIIALDFNSMFASCMEGQYLDPEEVYYEQVHSSSAEKSYPPGLYHVVLKRPRSAFFAEYHPFKYTQLGLSLHFDTEQSCEIETQLFHFELEVFKEYFEEVYIFSVLRSSRLKGHPLYTKSRRLYSLRMKAKRKNKLELEKLYKLQLAMLHSVTNKKSYKKVVCESYSELLNLLNVEYSLTLHKEQPLLMNSSPLLKKIGLKNNNDKLVGSFIDLNSSETIFSFSSQVIAKSRLKVFQTLVELKKFNDLDICYINTDSIHISIPRDSYHCFMERYAEMLGDDIGKLKVQAMAGQAIWFDIGHYFLLENANIVKWANSGLNHKGNKNPHLGFRERYRKLKVNNRSTILKEKVTFLSSLSYKKNLPKNIDMNLDKIDYQRFKISEIASFDQASLRIMKERQKSFAVKKQYFDFLRAHYV